MIHLDLAKELKKQCHMMVTVILIVIGILGMVLKSLEKKLGELETRERSVTIQTTALLRSARILWRVLDIGGDLLSFRLRRKPTT